MLLSDLVNRERVKQEERFKTYSVRADAQGRVYDYVSNSDIARMFEIELTKELIDDGFSLDEFLDIIEIPELTEAYHEMEREEITNFELHGDIMKGGHTVVHPHINLQRTQRGDYELLIRDETKLTHTKRVVEEALKLYGTALRVVAHEFRNPLATIKLALNYILRRGEPQNQREITTIGAAVKRLEEMINAYLKLSRVESGTYEPEITCVPLYEGIIKPVNEMMSGLYRNSIYTIEREGGLDLEDDDIGISCDATTLRGTYENLISNAIKYGGDGTEIAWNVTREDSFLNITVRNTKSYLTEEERDNLFKRFYRVERLEKSAPGMGLGLHLNKRLLQESDGDIVVASDGESYTEFTIIIPYKQ